MQPVYPVYKLASQGSVTGGFLARPASKYPLFDVPFFCHFPYVLPCMVALTMAIIGLIGRWSCDPQHMIEYNNGTE